MFPIPGSNVSRTDRVLFQTESSKTYRTRAGVICLYINAWLSNSSIFIWPKNEEMTIQLFVWIFTICCYFQIVDFFVYVQMSNRRRWLSDSLIIFRVRYNAHPQFYLPVPTLIFLEVLNSRNDCWTRFWNATKMWDILNDDQDFYILTTMCPFYSTTWCWQLCNKVFIPDIEKHL